MSEIIINCKVCGRKLDFITGYDLKAQGNIILWTEGCLNCKPKSEPSKTEREQVCDEIIYFLNRNWCKWAILDPVIQGIYEIRDRKSPH